MIGSLLTITTGKIYVFLHKSVSFLSYHFITGNLQSRILHFITGNLQSRILHFIAGNLQSRILHFIAHKSQTNTSSQVLRTQNDVNKTTYAGENMGIL